MGRSVGKKRADICLGVVLSNKEWQLGIIWVFYFKYKKLVSNEILGSKKFQKHP
jgi:hypothetical protein